MNKKPHSLFRNGVLNSSPHHIPTRWLEANYEGPRPGWSVLILERSANKNWGVPLLGYENGRDIQRITQIEIRPIKVRMGLV